MSLINGLYPSSIQSPKVESKDMTFTMVIELFQSKLIKTIS